MRTDFGSPEPGRSDSLPIPRCKRLDLVGSVSRWTSRSTALAVRLERFRGFEPDFLPGGVSVLLTLEPQIKQRAETRPVVSHSLIGL